GFDLLGWRHAGGIVLVNTRLRELSLDVGRLYRLVLSNLRIGETRAMSQKILHDNRPGRRYVRISDLTVRTRGCHAHLHVFEGRQEFGDGIGELDDAIFDQHHSRHRSERLGHRVNAKNRIGLHGRIRTLVLEADGVRINDLPLTGDHDHRPRQLAFSNLFFEHGRDAPEALSWTRPPVPVLP